MKLSKRDYYTVAGLYTMAIGADKRAQEYLDNIKEIVGDENIDYFFDGVYGWQTEWEKLANEHSIEIDDEK